MNCENCGRSLVERYNSCDVHVLRRLNKCDHFETLYPAFMKRNAENALMNNTKKDIVIDADNITYRDAIKLISRFKKLRNKLPITTNVTRNIFIANGPIGSKMLIKLIGSAFGTISWIDNEQLEQLLQSTTAT